MIRIDQELVLRPISLSSSKFIFKSVQQSKAHLRKWLPFVDATKTITDTRRFIKSILNNPCMKQDRIFEIWYNNSFAGLVSLKEIDTVNRKLELGYWLDKEMIGKGIMIRSVKTIIDYSFEILNMNRVMIKVVVGNIKSTAIPIKKGFHFEGIERNGELLNNNFCDLEIYSLLKSDWH